MKREEFKIEVCADSLQSVLAAKNAGADSVEVCSSIQEGGITPSYGLIRHAAAVEGLAVHVMIRPRSGDFLYSELEQEMMLQDIAAAKFLGADGIVCGMLNADGSVDASFLKKCIRAAMPLSFTFNRAFDMCRDPFEALSMLEYCGCARLCTSGLQNTALEGAPLLARLYEKASHITLMPAGSISPSNIEQIARETGAREFHFSAQIPKPSGMMFRNTAISLGYAAYRHADNPDPAQEYATQVASETQIREIIQKLESLCG